MFPKIKTIAKKKIKKKCQKSNFCQKIKTFAKNQTFSQKNQNFCQNSNFLPKNKTFAKSQKIPQKSKLFPKKSKILLKIKHFSKKSKILPKKLFPKIRPKIKIDEKPVLQEDHLFRPKFEALERAYPTKNPIPPANIDIFTN